MQRSTNSPSRGAFPENVADAPAACDGAVEGDGPGAGPLPLIGSAVLRGERIVSLRIDGVERLCLAQISNTLLRRFSYNEIHNRRVALGITCVQCTPVQVGTRRALSRTLAHSRALSLTLVHSRALSHTLARSRALSRTLAHSRALSRTLAHSRALSRTLARSGALSRTLTHYRTLSRTITHSSTLASSCTFSHPLAYSGHNFPLHLLSI